MPRFPVTPDVVQAYNFDAVLAKKYFIVCVPTGKALNEISRKFSQYYLCFLKQQFMRWHFDTLSKESTIIRFKDFFC